MVITSLAGTISTSKDGLVNCASTCRITCGCPTRRTLTPYSSAARTLPSTSGRGAWSPPMASTAIVIMGFFRRLQLALDESAHPNQSPSGAWHKTRSVTSCREPAGLCNNRNGDKPGAAASFRGNSDTWPSRARTSGRARDACSCAPWNVGVLDLALRHSCVSPCSWQHTSPVRTRSDSMGFWPGNLLFLEPVLLQPGEGSQPRVRGMGLAAALFVIEIRAAGGTQSAAIALANHLHRQ